MILAGGLTMVDNDRAASCYIVVVHILFLDVFFCNGEAISSPILS